MSFQTQENDSKIGQTPVFLFAVLLILCTIMALVGIYYRRKFVELKDLLYVEYSNQPQEPRHFDNPVYASTTTCNNRENSKLLNNLSGIINNNLGSKNTNITKCKWDEFDKKADSIISNVYEVPNNNFYSDIDDDISKVSNKSANFYHTIDELDHKIDNNSKVKLNNRK